MASAELISITELLGRALLPLELLPALGAGLGMPLRTEAKNMEQCGKENCSPDQFSF